MNNPPQQIGNIMTKWITGYMPTQRSESKVHECGYCLMEVTQDERVWVDETGGDCCSGNDYTLVNENGTHEVFSPVEGYAPVCLSYIEHDEDFCALCFHREDEHTTQASL